MELEATYLPGCAEEARPIGEQPSCMGKLGEQGDGWQFVSERKLHGCLDVGDHQR